MDENEREHVIPTRFGEKAYTKVRHFVVAKEMQGASLCLPLNTNNRNGVAGKGIRAENYAAVYSFGGHPEVTSDEHMVKDPFPIMVETPEETIDPMSRLDFGQVHTVRHNLKVSKVGRIPDENLPLLDRYFAETITSSEPTSDSSFYDNLSSHYPINTKYLPPEAPISPNNGKLIDSSAPRAYKVIKGDGTLSEKLDPRKLRFAVNIYNADIHKGLEYTIRNTLSLVK